ncbi:vesicular glutamate transporter 1 [Elysia marginata]|uniref:Vesicular glutamate transporter 1 n=1 Tax=Elysia marginata TaxID=1093978 RepID=A0AAV4F769_9GAST|nr:vesicular glutamate transporter 1 [Elysia marginata]
MAPANCDETILVLAFIGRAVCLTSVGYVTHDNRYVAVCLLGLSGFFAGMQQAGYVANFIDIGPRFAGVMFGIGNSIATVTGIVSPIVVGAITSGKSREEWQIVFFICAGISILAAILFDCFAQGHVQAWAVEVTAELDVDAGGSDVPGDDSLKSSDYATVEVVKQDIRRSL